MEETPAPSFFDFSLFGWPLTGLVTLFALAVTFWLAWKVGRARGKYGVKVPHTIGPEEFLRIFRAHQNTVEFLVLFLPLLWMAALSSRDEVAAAIGVIWPIARIFYALGYYKDPAKRLVPFMLNIGVIVTLFLLVLVRLIYSLMYYLGEQPTL